MEVTYTLEKSDYLRLGWFVIGRVPALRWQAISRFSGFPVLNVVVSYGFHFSLVMYLLNVFGFTIIWIGYLWWAQRQAMISLAQARPDSFGVHTISLQTDGLYNRTTVLDTRVQWHSIAEVAENLQMILLFLSPRYGFIIPKRAFADPAQASAFLETARAYRRSACEGTPPVLPSVPASWPPAPQRMQ